MMHDFETIGLLNEEIAALREALSETASVLGSILMTEYVTEDDHKRGTKLLRRLKREKLA